jgi:DnaJ-like protein
MSADPYRTLGLTPGASTAEVKRAYRRLAKSFHPDSAGEAALPRFLAIHEAYEAIRAGRPWSGARASGSPTAAAGSTGGPVRSEPWRADPARARAARERARTGRSQRAGASAPGGAGAAGFSGTTGRSKGSSSASGSTGPGSSAGSSRGRGSGRRRETRKATLGSTSYDEARDPADATWSGASWYGPTTGEYWIVNPREYADPRKHGPDYQSRARRPAGGEPVEDSIEAPDRSGQEAEPPKRPGRPRFEAPRPRADPRRAGRSSPWSPPDGVRDGESIDGRAASTAPRSGATGDAAFRPRGRFAAASREWLGGPADDPIRRLGIALVAWPPIGLAAAAAIGDLTGCTTYAAACGGTDTVLPWLAQAGILGLLLLLPPVARLLAAGTVAVVLALVPVTAFLVVVGGTGQAEAGFALAFLLGAVWLVGVGWAIAAAGRRTAAAAAGRNP